MLIVNICTMADSHIVVRIYLTGKSYKKIQIMKHNMVIFKPIVIEKIASSYLSIMKIIVYTNYQTLK